MLRSAWGKSVETWRQDDVTDLSSLDLSVEIDDGMTMINNINIPILLVTLPKTAKLVADKTWDGVPKTLVMVVTYLSLQVAISGPGARSSNQDLTTEQRPGGHGFQTMAALTSFWACSLLELIGTYKVSLSLWGWPDPELAKKLPSWLEALNEPSCCTLQMVIMSIQMKLMMQDG